MHDPGKIVVVYGSKYGSTQRYARWIAERTGADIFHVSAFDRALLARYETVLFGSPVYMGRIKHIRFVKHNWGALKEKRVVIFAVTGVPQGDPRQIKAYEASLPEAMRRRTVYFPLRGAFNYGRLNLVDKLLMSGPRIRVEIESRVHRKGEELVSRFLTPQDWTSPAAIDPIVAFLGK